MSSPIVLDKLKNVLVINNEAHALSKNEVLLLEHLYLRGGEVIPRDELISTCWPSGGIPGFITGGYQAYSRCITQGDPK